jgi:hypothetical protein
VSCLHHTGAYDENSYRYHTAPSRISTEVCIVDLMPIQLATLQLATLQLATLQLVTFQLAILTTRHSDT